MTTPADSTMHIPAADSPSAKRSVAQYASRLFAFSATPEARPAKLGFLGSALITAGGLGAGSTRPTMVLPAPNPPAVISAEPKKPSFAGRASGVAENAKSREAY